MTGTPGTCGPTAQLRLPQPRVPSSGWGRGGAGERTGRRAGSLPPRLSGCGGPAVSGPGLGCLGVPARVHQHLSFFPHRRRLLIRARQLQQRLQTRCAKPGRSGASRRGCGGRVDSGEEAAASGRGPCAAPRRVGAACCGRILRGPQPRRG